MGILDLHVLILAPLVIAIWMWSRSLRRQGRRPRLAQACGFIAVASLAVEIGVQFYGARLLNQVDQVDASEKATTLARALSLGLSASAIELGVLVLTLGALAIAAATSARPGVKSSREGAAGAACSECGRDRISAGPLAKGQHILLCADCAATAVVEIESQLDQGSLVWTVIADILARLPPETAAEESIRMVDAAAALTGGDPEPVRWVAHEAARLSHTARAIELLEGLGAALIADDQISIAYYAFLGGDTRRGLGALERVDVGELDDRGRLYFHLNRAALALDADASTATIERATEDMDEVHELIERCGNRITREELTDLLGAERLGLARLDLAHERWDAARKNLVEATGKYGDQRAFVLVLLGDAEAAAGNREAAEATWRRALAAAPPSSHHAAQARGRLGGPYR